MMVINILIYAIRLAPLLPSYVIIYNQCPNIKLALSAYFGNGIVYPELSGQQVDISTTTKASFEINITQEDFEGALLFRLQRYSNSQCNTDKLIMATDKSETTHVHMLVAWKVKDSKPFANVILVEHIKEFIWNENKLRKMYDKNYNRLKEYDDTISNTWFIDDNMTLKTTFRVRNVEENFKLSISISKEVRNYYAMRPLWIELEG
jgi:hypothetical protein